MQGYNKKNTTGKKIWKNTISGNEKDDGDFIPHS